MNYYGKYIKYKLKYLSCIQKKYNFDSLEEKIKNNISLTENFIKYLSKLNPNKKNIVLNYAKLYNHQQIIILLS